MGLGPYKKWSTWPSMVILMLHMIIIINCLRLFINLYRTLNDLTGANFKKLHCIIFIGENMQKVWQGLQHTIMVLKARRLTSIHTTIHYSHKYMVLELCRLTSINTSIHYSHKYPHMVTCTHEIRFYTISFLDSKYSFIYS
jgi:hypothetical protein